LKPLQWALFEHKETPTYVRGNLCLLGDSAHATTPFQAAGAGQAVEDALMLSRLLSEVKNPGQLEAAFQVYDAVQRPRAQKIVDTSREAGLIYDFEHPVLGSDMDAITKNLEHRFEWIWNEDHGAAMDKALSDFHSLTAAEL